MDMETLDTKDLSPKVVTALDYIYEQLMNKYPNVNFTIKKKMLNSNLIMFIIHDEDVFFDPKFQQWAFKELQETYLFPQAIINIAFTFQKI